MAAKIRGLQPLLHRAYALDLETALAQLEVQFSRWRAREIDAFELNESIHRFHDGTSRDLYKLYGAGRVHAEAAVAQAIARGLLPVDEVPADVMSALERTVEAIKMSDRLGSGHE